MYVTIFMSGSTYALKCNWRNMDSQYISGQYCVSSVIMLSCVLTFINRCFQVRQLLSECDGGRQTYQPGTVGYGGAGRLRPTETPVIPTDRRVPYMLLARQPCLI